MMKLLSILVIASYFQISVICSKGRVSNIQISKVFHEITTKSTNGPGACVAKNCYKESIVCTSDPSCFEATQCNAECLTAPDIDSCNLLCELNYGFNNTAYTVLLDCMVENGCLPQSPYDGMKIK